MMAHCSALESSAPGGISKLGSLDESRSTRGLHAGLPGITSGVVPSTSCAYAWSWLAK